MQKSLARFVIAGWAGFVASSLVAADGRIDVSRLIDKATAESALGDTVKEPVSRNLEGTDGYYSKCNFYTSTPGKSLVIRVYQAAAGFNPYKELEMVVESSGAMRAVPGLGDKARISSGTDSGLPAHVVMLYVVKGNALVTVGLGGLPDETQAQEKTKGIAQKILAEL